MSKVSVDFLYAKSKSKDLKLLTTTSCNTLRKKNFIDKIRQYRIQSNNITKNSDITFVPCYDGISNYSIKQELSNINGLTVLYGQDKIPAKFIRRSTQSNTIITEDIMRNNIDKFIKLFYLQGTPEFNATIINTKTKQDVKINREDIVLHIFRKNKQGIVIKINKNTPEWVINDPIDIVVADDQGNVITTSDYKERTSKIGIIGTEKNNIKTLQNHGQTTNSFTPEVMYIQATTIKKKI